MANVEGHKDRRQFARRKVLFSGELGCGEHSFGCRIRDLSYGGAELEFPVPLASGADIAINIPRFGRFGARVAWQIGKKLGIEFTDDARITQLRLSRCLGIAEEPALAMA